MTRESPNVEPKPEKSETIENIIALVVIGIVIFIFIGFSQSWWGMFEKETTEPVVITSISGEPFKGDENAPITIVEYSDFECPFCGRWLRDVYPAIKSTYIDTGRAKLVFKQFPLTQIHKKAMPAAIAAECAFRQGNDEFWKYHDVLFENQLNLDVENLKKYAEQVGLNTAQFNVCLDDKHTESEVSSDYTEGTNSGVTGTPAFIIGEERNSVVKGEILVGSLPFASFVEVIDRLE